MSLKNRILSYLQRNFPRSIPSGELQRLALEAGFTPANAARRARELENENKILVHYEKGCAVYQFKPIEKVVIQTKLI